MKKENQDAEAPAQVSGDQVGQKKWAKGKVKGEIRLIDQVEIDDRKVDGPGRG